MLLAIDQRPHPVLCDRGLCNKACASLKPERERERDRQTDRQRLLARQGSQCFVTSSWFPVLLGSPEQQQLLKGGNHTWL